VKVPQLHALRDELVEQMEAGLANKVGERRRRLLARAAGAYPQVAVPPSYTPPALPPLVRHRAAL
jgi:hypothetical protein